MAASLPMPPIAIPTLARASAGASLTPSPIIATAPCVLLELGDHAHLVLGQQPTVLFVHARPARDRLDRVLVVPREHREPPDAQRAQRDGSWPPRSAAPGPRPRSRPTPRRSGRSSRSWRPPANASTLAIAAARRRDAQRREQLRRAHLDRPARVGRDETLAQVVHHLLGGRERRCARASAARTTACASGCGERFSAAAANASSSFSVRALDRHDVGHLEAAVRERARLVERDHADAAQRLDEPAALEQDAVARGVGDRRQDRSRASRSPARRARRPRAASSRGRARRGCRFHGRWQHEQREPQHERRRRRSRRSCSSGPPTPPPPRCATSAPAPRAPASRCAPARCWRPRASSRSRARRAG